VIFKVSLHQSSVSMGPYTLWQAKCYRKRFLDVVFITLLYN